MKRVISIAVIMIMLCSLVSGCGADKEQDQKPAAKQSKYGGTITVASKETPPHLDSDKSTVWMISEVMNHVQEGLFEFDENSKAQPHLAKSYDIKDNGKTYDIKLREGVLFHNGKEMTAEDVKASFDRWLENNGAGEMIKPYFESAQIKDTYEIEFKFKEPYAPFLNILGSPVACQKLVIKPKEIVEKYGDQVMTEYVGTGPYEFADWVPDQYIKLKRFEGYVASENPASGFAGKRIAYADEIVFKLVPELDVRTSGVQTGEFQFAEEVGQDQYELFESNPDVNTIIVEPDLMGMLAINCGNAPFDNIYARKALAYGMDMEELGLAQIGNQKFWRTGGSLFSKGNIWYDENAGEGVYNVHDIEKAKEMLKKSGYDGTPIVILNGKDDNVESQGAIALKDQLEDIGFNVELQLYDRPTVVEQRSKVDAWNLHLTYFLETNPDPQVFGAWVGTNGWISNWDDEYSKQMDEIFERMLGETDYQKRYEIVKEWYDEFWDTLPYIKTINYSRLHLANKSLKGYPDTVQPFFCNTWVEEQ